MVEPTPTLPLARTVKMLAPDDVATLNTIDVPLAVVDATLKAIVEDVAPTPATKPLSWKRPVESVVGDVQRARRPFDPPVTPLAVILSVDVDTHLVVVPVVWRSIPKVPVALAESVSGPVMVNFEVVAFSAKKLVVDAFVAAKLFVAVAFKKVTPPVNVPVVE